MNAFETSDRRIKPNWETLKAGQSLSHGYFLEETLESIRLSEVRFSGFGILNSRFEGGQWLGVKLDRVDLACVCFRHVYFEGVDFGDCTFASVSFEGCVFSDCRFAQDSAGFERTGCYDTRSAVPALAAEQSLEAAPSAPRAEPIVAKTSQNTVHDRFDRIER